jgi:hypothetical protein
MTKNNKTATESNKPAHEIRHGGLRVTIWGNKTEAGIRYNVTQEKSYKDGEQWKQTQSYGSADLLVLARMLEQAFDWINAATTAK